MVTGAFGQNSQERGSDAGIQAMRGLARLMLAQPENVLAAQRANLLATLGPGAAAIAAMMPEYELLLRVRPQLPDGDPYQVQSQIHRIGIEVLRVISATRPVVMVLDDLQWAVSFSLGMIDEMLNDPDLPGVLLVGAYRDGDPGRPLTEMLVRWTRLGVVPPRLRLRNLPPIALAALLTQILRMPAPEAARLAGAVGARTNGNPYDTVELLNALRAEGSLVAGPGGWTWDPVAIRRHVGPGEVVDLLAARIARLPEPASAVLEVLAFLGGRAGVVLLASATGTSVDTVQEDLAPAVDDGLVVLEAGIEPDDGATVRFRNDRVRTVAYGRGDSGDGSRARLQHLVLARRLAQDPDAETMAAEQYLHAITGVREPEERRLVVGLFRRTAVASRVTDPETAERYLASASALLGDSAAAGDGTELTSVQMEHHAVLFSLGRFEESDRVYQSIESGNPDPLELTGAACLQISGLTNRSRPLDALSLGLGLLVRLGLAVPSRSQVVAEIERGERELYQWVEEDARAAELARPEVTDPQVNAVAAVINRMTAPAYFADLQVLTWLVLESRRLWAERGPCRALLGPLGHVPLVLIGIRDDYRTARRVAQRVLEAGIARGYEPETSHSRFLSSVGVGHWFEPLEDDLEQALQARDGLLQAGDLQNAAFTFHVSTPSLLDCAPTLDRYLPTVEAGLALAARTGNEQTFATGLPYRQLVRALRGETDGPGELADSSFDENGYLRALAANPMAAANYHITRALIAALFGDQPALVQHARVAMPLLPYLLAAYSTSRAYLLQALALAGLARAADPVDRPPLIAELDLCRDWLARRSEDAPGNYAHLLAMVDAERAWAVGDLYTAVSRFDEALSRIGDRQRPWQLALICERAAEFSQAQGHDYFGRRLLVTARDVYSDWGATAKVEQLVREHPFLLTAWSDGETGEVTAPSPTVPEMSSDSMDLLAVLEASQALSSETDLDRLRVRVVDVLTAMTGATTVTVVLWSDEVSGWVLPATSDVDPLGDSPRGEAMSVAEPAAAGLLPLSAFWYAERTRQPLLVPDATTDDRFSIDPYVLGARCCSLLVVPILSQGSPRVMLVLENRLHRSAFSTDRLDSVMLIAGQLAVSFDNAQARRLSEQEADRRLRLLDTVRQRERLLKTLLAIQRDISHRAPLQQVLDAVTAGASAMLHDDFVALVLVDPLAPDQPRIPSISGRTGQEQDALVLSVATESITRDALVTRPAAVDSGGLIAAPVHARGKIIGSLVAGDDPEHRAEQREMLSAFAQQISLALTDANTVEAMREAYHDQLTGLPNRALFLDRLHQAIAINSGHVTVLFIDLDRFKAVNDSLGHKAGDDLLAAVAERVTTCIRSGDTASRLGGDEFAIMLKGAGPRTGVRVAREIIAAVKEPFRIQGREVYIAASVGVASTRGSGTDAGDLLSNADVAMYRAKKAGPGRIIIFEPHMHAEVVERLHLQADLQRALNLDEFRLQFQPLVRLHDGQPIGVEALLRWTHPERGIVPPSMFDPGGRGDRPDHRAGPVGTAGELPPGRGMAGDGPGPERQRQRLGAADHGRGIRR